MLVYSFAKHTPKSAVGPRSTPDRGGTLTVTRTRTRNRFKVKPAWLLAELEPYLEGIVGPDKKGEVTLAPTLTLTVTLGLTLTLTPTRARTRTR